MCLWIFPDIIHVIGCLWYGVGRGGGDKGWVIVFGFEEDTIASRYLTSCYWALTTMTSVGYGDISPVNGAERGVGGFVMGGGFGELSRHFGTGASNLLQAAIRSERSQVEVSWR